MNRVDKVLLEQHLHIAFDNMAASVASGAPAAECLQQLGAARAMLDIAYALNIGTNELVGARQMWCRYETRILSDLGLLQEVDYDDH